jgi:class 3 adenylate cyclase
MAGAYRFAEQIGGALYSASLLEQVQEERARSDRLLLNILPQKVAVELREQGAVKPVQYDQVTVLFTEFVGFTRIAERISADELLSELDGCFSQFDDVIAHHGLEKLKTIGDAYMCCGGLPEPNYTHAIDACLAALEFQNFMRQMREIKAQLGYDFWELRVGLNTGPVMAGVVGKNKFAYDIWGDTVNTASRMESAGAPGRVNISRSTYDQVKYFFKVERRGLVEAKGKGRMEMFFLKGLRSFVSRNGDGQTPNDEFYRLYNIVKSGGKLRFRRELEPAAGVESV